MDINATLIGQMITFAIFIWFTMKYVWPPLMKVMDERHKKIAEGLAAAERGRHDLELAKHQISVDLDAAKNQAALIIEHANQRANHMVEEAKDRARSEGERLLHLAQADIAQEYNQAKTELVQHISRLALTGAERILKHNIDAKANQQLLNELIEEI
ncbi:MAG TPA: F0F1 ATP synthase subunit B [Coxiellaceae bacterium]|nr:F0F1 ATP synthase subunit B [Coxiellaceae bacterium]